MIAKSKKYTYVDALVMIWTKYQIGFFVLWLNGFIKSWWVTWSPTWIPIGLLGLSWFLIFLYFMIKPKYERYKMRRLTKRKKHLGDDIEKLVNQVENG